MLFAYLKMSTYSNNLSTTFDCNLMSKLNLYFDIKFGDYILTENQYGLWSFRPHAPRKKLNLWI